ncbi:unnamed protein product [Chondrus crispus]|uniref:Uncharacterized protein n=1 Tax=Chondrus crispus TaxID=2769 RepID=R7QE83_CHOCR|nr:unnamed protein product [Chondrus crispus]CDF36822.1 unnamed protein product [Chondrus crispus]|eukprot:XP_005716641.1 unnamed protein product [Chondrus crispus]
MTVEKSRSSYQLATALHLYSCDRGIHQRELRPLASNPTDSLVQIAARVCTLLSPSTHQLPNQSQPTSVFFFCLQACTENQGQKDRYFQKPLHELDRFLSLEPL